MLLMAIVMLMILLIAFYYLRTCHVGEALFQRRLSTCVAVFEPLSRIFF